MNKCINFLYNERYKILGIVGGILCLLIKYLNLIPKSLGDYIIKFLMCCVGSYIFDIMAVLAFVLALGSYIYSWQENNATRVEIRKIDIEQLKYSDMQQEIKTLKDELLHMKDIQYKTMINNQDKIMDYLKGMNNV